MASKKKTVAPAPSAAPSADDLLRVKFKELCAERDAIRAKRDPLRAARDKYVQNAHAETLKLDEVIRQAEEGLFDLDNEIAKIARALGHKTG